MHSVGITNSLDPINPIDRPLAPRVSVRTAQPPDRPNEGRPLLQSTFVKAGAETRTRGYCEGADGLRTRCILGIDDNSGVFALFVGFTYGENLFDPSSGLRLALRARG